MIERYKRPTWKSIGEVKKREVTSKDNGGQSDPCMRGQLELKTSSQLQYAAFFIQGSVWPQLQEQFPHKNCFGNVSGDLIQNCSCCQKSPVYALKMRHACTWIIPCKLILVQLFVLKTKFFEQFVCFKDFPRLFYLWFSINRTTFL